MFDLDSQVSKRQIGLMAVSIGILAGLGVLLYDAVGLGSADGGFGPSQKIALLGAILTLVMGLSLIPLGDQAA